MGSETKCGPEGHGQTPTARYSRKALSRAVRLFKVLGDEARLQTLEMLVGREVRVTELAEVGGESISTVSHRLRLMRMEGLVERRREGRHTYYTLADDHVLELVKNALDHALENRPKALDDA